MVVRCAHCGAFTTDEEAELRALNTGTCRCGGQLFAHPVRVLTVHDHEDARLIVARIESWMANAREPVPLVHELLMRTATLLRRIIDVPHG